MIWAVFFENARFALRVFQRTPGFAAVAVLTLAVGIGANTSIFSVANALLLRPLAYRDPDRLVLINSHRKERQRQPGTAFRAALRTGGTAQPQFQRSGGLHLGCLQPDRAGRSGTGSLGARELEVFPGARCFTSAGAKFSRRGGQGGRRPGGDDQRRAVAAAFRARSGRDRQDDDSGWPRLHDHRRDAARFPVCARSGRRSTSSRRACSN